MHFNSFHLFVAEKLQDKESKEETDPVESDGTSSDYFADDETSSSGLFENDYEFTSNPKGKDAAEKGLTAKLFICLTVVFHQSLIASFGVHHCWSASSDGVGLWQQG